LKGVVGTHRDDQFRSHEKKYGYTFDKLWLYCSFSWLYVIHGYM